ncbi:MAG: hypothetical protein HWE24_20685 [Oceanospirillaceae bacterium]|nr:hypothetical protein [Oceanospirillaceae bacterium]
MNIQYFLRELLYVPKGSTSDSANHPEESRDRRKSGQRVASDVSLSEVLEGSCGSGGRFLNDGFYNLNERMKVIWGIVLLICASCTESPSGDFMQAESKPLVVDKEIHDEAVIELYYYSRVTSSSPYILRMKGGNDEFVDSIVLAHNIDSLSFLNDTVLIHSNSQLKLFNNPFHFTDTLIDETLFRSIVNQAE